MEQTTLKTANDLSNQILSLEQHLIKVKNKKSDGNHSLGHNHSYVKDISIYYPYENGGGGAHETLRLAFINSDELLLVYVAKVENHLAELKKQFEEL